MDAKMGKLTFSYIEQNQADAMYSHSSIYDPGSLKNAISCCIIIICIQGIIGNGIVMRHLLFKIKRNYFTVYILNLAMADIGTLIFLFLTGIWYLTNKDYPIKTIEALVWIYCTGQFLRTIISIERCLALFFPSWNQYHQLTYLSITWIVSVYVYGLNYALFGNFGVKVYSPFYYVFICFSVCIPLMLVSSLVLFIKGFLKSQTKRRGKLLKAILLSLFFFLIFSFPLIVIHFIYAIFNGNYLDFFAYGSLCACLSISVNPLIYFLLGRKKENHSTFDLNIMLQRVFKEEEESEDQPDVQVDSQQ